MTKAKLFAELQESSRKDVEQAFGVLWARFAIVPNLACLMEEKDIDVMMKACVSMILHNMIVKDERITTSLHLTTTLWRILPGADC